MVVTKFDVVGVGNAIVDVLSHSDDSFLDQHDLIKGSMTIIDSKTAEKLYGFMKSSIEISGGSAANTIACLAIWIKTLGIATPTKNRKKMWSFLGRQLSPIRNCITMPRGDYYILAARFVRIEVQILAAWLVA